MQMQPPVRVWLRVTRLYGETTMWKVSEETLSDGSSVFNVTDGEAVLHCTGETEAYELLDAIDRLTNDQVVPAE